MASPEGAPSAPERNAPPGDVVGRLLREELAPDLVVERRIGQETFGDLYLAKQPSVPREVVVTVLRAELADDAQARLRFARATAAAGNLQHPNVVEVFTTGELSTGLPFVVQPYLGECTLGDRLRALGRLQPRRVATILSDLASALDAAHRLGVVHRDVRLETVRCQESSDRVLLTDFGMAAVLESSGLEPASITRSREILAGLGVLSPEQVKGEPATDRSDVYGLGALGWRLLVGPDTRLPWEQVKERRYWRELEQEVGHELLVDLIRRCLAERPADRPRAIEIVTEIASMPEHGRRSRQSHSNLPPLIAAIVESQVHLVATFLAVVVTLIGVLTDLPDLPPVQLRLLVAFTAAGIAAILVFTWFHGKKGAQEFPPLERWLYVAIGAAWILASALIWSLGPA